VESWPGPIDRWMTPPTPHPILDLQPRDQAGYVTIVRHDGGYTNNPDGGPESVSTNNRQFSLYYDNLSGPAKARYKDKVEICGLQGKFTVF